MKRRRRSLAAQLRARGFDRTTYDRSTHYTHPRCSCCEALVINGIACHEQGCPNDRSPSRRLRRRG